MQTLSAAARAHFEHPHHVGTLALDAADVATARVGEPVSGAILQLQLQIDGCGTLTAARFQAYGCGWTVACGSWLAAWLSQRTVAEAAAFRHHLLVEALAVPPEKLHCAVLAETALKAALRAYATKPTPPVALQSQQPSP
ncbi:MAG: iron-sulfur cluster assembly scaffold protein [Candidatus Contendobacter sp.]